ncbi:unnamed protein product [Bursaphelenchus xylophilus]|uniref:(pine wood nematode) hypothetical protein n=1 Tax=Bursaphelenchus xylophilus TaxID=6326 RepID=A0A1I7SUM9_BURXY|nr:unnamed protein product [Bursaphelenchus xylophilus]CAG9126003.1 unnamed protein product [Bursaphelenchus xylophilus]
MCARRQSTTIMLIFSLVLGTFVESSVIRRSLGRREHLRNLVDGSRIPGFPRLQRSIPPMKIEKKYRKKNPMCFFVSIPCTKNDYLTA